MVRPALTLLLWLALAVLIVVNDVIGDAWMATRLSGSAVEWYKVLVPLPYAVLLAIIHARRTKGPHWLEAALVATLLWPTSTVFVDFLYGRFVFGVTSGAFLDRFAIWWGAPYPLLIVVLLVGPLVAGFVLARR